MGLRERFEKLLREKQFQVGAYKWPSIPRHDAINSLIAAICAEEGHKTITTHTEQLGGGRFRDHFKCLRCDHVRVGPKGQKYPDGTVGYE